MPLGSSLPTRLPFSSGAGGTYYVDPANTTGAASDSHSTAQAQSRSTPWLTIQHALNSVPLTGSIVKVIGNGISVQSTSLLGLAQWTRAGSITDPVTLMCETPKGVTITGSATGGAQVRGILVGNGTAGTVGTGLRIQGFIFSVGGRDSEGVSFNPAQHCEVYQCTFTGCGGLGLVMKGYQGGQTSNSWAISCRLYGNSNDTAFDPTKALAHQMYLGQDGSSNTVTAGCDSCVVANCVFHAPLPPGFHIQIGPQWHNGFIVNNTFLGGNWVSSVTTTKTTGGDGCIGYADNATVGTSGNIVANNIFYKLPGISAGGAGTGFAIAMGTILNNLSFGNQHINPNYTYTPSPGDYTSSWGGHTLWTIGTNLANANPLFVMSDSSLNTPGQINVTLQSGSPAIGQSLVQYTPSEDYDGNARSATAPSLGALEAAATSGAPANTVSPAVTGTAIVGNSLASDNGTWTNTPTSYAYQWQRDGHGDGVFGNIAGATASSYTLVDADDGCNLRCVVTATNASGSASASSNLVPIVEPAPVNTVAPAITGGSTVESVLSCSTGTWTNMAGFDATFGFQWQRDSGGDGVFLPIQGATGQTYTLVDADIGNRVSCAVTASNTSGNPGEADAAATDIVAKILAANTVAPAITGAPIVGQTLHCDPGAWSGDPAPTFSFQWQSSPDGTTWTNIVGATSQDWLVTVATLGEFIRCEVTATN